MTLPISGSARVAIDTCDSGADRPAIEAAYDTGIPLL
jgi:hypothetical protein